METMRNAMNLISYFVIPLMLVGFPLYGLYKRVPVYESFVEGAKEGFQVAVRIIPYLVAILFVTGTCLVIAVIVTKLLGHLPAYRKSDPNLLPAITVNA